MKKTAISFIAAGLLDRRPTAFWHKNDCIHLMDHHSMVDCNTMSSHTNIATLYIEGGDVTINFYNGGEVVETHQSPPPRSGPRPSSSSPPPTASTPPPAPGGSAQRPGCSFPSPDYRPNASGSTRRAHVSAPKRQFVRDETVDAVNNLMKRVRQDETDRADMELARVNELAHREIDRVRARVAQVESGDSSSSD